MTGAWMTTITGQDHVLSGLTVLCNRIDVYDIAHALAQINRYTGHAFRPYSVAEHSLLVADMARADNKSTLVQLACLMHDAHEAYTGDLSSPAKQAVGLKWWAFESVQADSVRRAFGLTTAFSAYRQLIGRYDLMALATERAQLTNFAEGRNGPWPVIDTPGKEVPPVTWVDLTAAERTERTWSQWKNAWLGRYFELARVAAPEAELMDHVARQAPGTDKESTNAAN